MKLKRDLGLLEVTVSGIGLILGAGIYALIGKAVLLAGNAVWLSFIISALVAVFTGLSYAELASMYPRAGAEYEYTRQAFGKRFAFVVGYLIILSGAIGSSTVALGFAGYMESLSSVPQIPSALGLIVVLSAVQLMGIKQSTRLAMIFTLIEASGLVLIALIGIPYLGDVNYFEMPHGFSGIFGAATLIFFAFMGFEEMVKLAEETKNPEKNIPRGLILAVSASILIYMAVAISSVSVMGWERLGASSAPFADLAGLVFGEKAFVLLSIIAIFATTNTVLLMMVAAARIMYGMARSGSLPRQLSLIHPKTQVPWTATLAVSLMAVLFITQGDIVLVANLTNLTVFVTFLVVNAALIRLRYTRPDQDRPFRSPLSIGRLPILPVAGIVSCCTMISQITYDVLLMGAVLIAIGWLISRVR